MPSHLFVHRLLALSAASMLITVAASGQAMVEYGHLAGAAANSSGGLRKASPGTTFKRLEGALSGANSRSAARTTGARAVAPTSGVRDVRPVIAPLTVLDIQWGPSSPSSEDLQEVDSKTLAKKHVLDESAAETQPSAPPDLRAKGLSVGMGVSEVSKILGDPVIRTAGLDGRGFDEKRLHKLEPGWKIMVFASRGRVTALQPAPAPQKSADTVLRAADSVVP